MPSPRLESNMVSVGNKENKRGADHYDTRSQELERSKKQKLRAVNPIDDSILQTEVGSFDVDNSLVHDDMKIEPTWIGTQEAKPLYDMRMLSFFPIVALAINNKNNWDEWTKLEVTHFMHEQQRRWENEILLNLIKDLGL